MMQLFFLLLTIAACYAVPSNFVRPCPKNDYACIGRNLAGNSYCNPNVRGSLPAEYIINRFPFYTPYFNSSYIDWNLRIKNHDQCKLSEFFFNLETDNLVLSIRCPDLYFESTRTLIQHYPEAEDLVYSYDYQGTYPLVILTVNLRPANAIDLCQTLAFSYVASLPNFLVSPNDIETKNFLTTDLSFMNIFERETFFWRGQELLRYFVNSRLCNFGCNF